MLEHNIVDATKLWRSAENEISMRRVIEPSPFFVLIYDPRNLPCHVVNMIITVVLIRTPKKLQDEQCRLNRNQDTSAIGQTWDLFLLGTLKGRNYVYAGVKIFLVCGGGGASIVLLPIVINFL
jgi:hypothetical protein